MLPPPRRFHLPRVRLSGNLGGSFRTPRASRAIFSQIIVGLQHHNGNQLACQVVQRINAPAGSTPRLIQRTPASDLIAMYTVGPNLREEALGGALRDLLPAPSDLVISVFRTLSIGDRDDVAFALLDGVQDSVVRTWAQDSGARAALQLMVDELATGLLLAKLRLKPTR